MHVQVLLMTSVMSKYTFADTIKFDDTLYFAKEYLGCCSDIVQRYTSSILLLYMYIQQIA